VKLYAGPQGLINKEPLFIDPCPEREIWTVKIL